MPLPLGFRRLAYRSAHLALRGYWFVRRPRVDGAKCVLTRGEKVLLARHTYGRREWDLPGGKVKHGEAPEHTARREIGEELGVDLGRWTALGVVRGSAYHRRDVLHCFWSELDDQPLTIDRGEIEAIEWFDRRRLPSDVSAHVHEILARVERDGDRHR